jgi:hypothetical protein
LFPVADVGFVGELGKPDGQRHRLLSASVQATRHAHTGHGNRDLFWDIRIVCRCLPPGRIAVGRQSFRTLFYGSILASCLAVSLRPSTGALAAIAG